MQVACTHDSSMALAADGTLYSFGANDLGQLGRRQPVDGTSALEPASCRVCNASGKPIHFSKVQPGQ